MLKAIKSLSPVVNLASTPLRRGRVACLILFPIQAFHIFTFSPILSVCAQWPSTTNEYLLVQGHALHTNRVTVAVLNVQHDSPRDTMPLKGTALSGLLVAQLKEAPSSIILRPCLDTVEYLQRQLAPLAEASLTPAHLNAICANAGADWLILAHLNAKHGGYVVKLRFWHSLKHAFCESIELSLPGCREVRDQLATLVPKAIGVNVDPSESANMRSCWSVSASALEHIEEAATLQQEGRDLTSVEKCLRQAIEADPQFSEAHAWLAGILDAEGDLSGAKSSAKAAITLRPNSTFARLVLSSLHTGERNYHDAISELEEAARLDAQSVTLWLRLGEAYNGADRFEEATSALARARELDKSCPLANAYLALVYAKSGKHEEALATLTLAESVTPQTLSDRVNTELLLCSAYVVLNEQEKALRHACNLAKDTADARERRADPAIVNLLQNAVFACKAKLPCMFVTNAPPLMLSSDKLKDELNQRLTPKEALLVLNPFASNIGMSRWAHELTATATNELDKAALIFRALSTRNDDPTRHDAGTAEEVYSAWTLPARSFHCQEYTFLYVTLARRAGLRANHAVVTELWDGSRVFHACAIVFVGERGILVDPALRWFGVLHKKFVVVDDLQSAAIATASIHNETGSLLKARIAVKLAPTMPLVQLSLLQALIDRGLWDEARQVMAVIESLKADEQILNWGRAQLALHDGEFAAALRCARDVIRSDPYASRFHFIIAEVCCKQGQYIDARRALEAASLCQLNEAERNVVNARMHRLGELMR